MKKKTKVNIVSIKESTLVNIIQSMANSIPDPLPGKRRVGIVPLPKEMLNSKVRNMTFCTHAIPCVSLTFENGYRMDIAVEREGNPAKAHQILKPKENPYFDLKTKKHLKIK